MYYKTGEAGRHDHEQSKLSGKTHRHRRHRKQRQPPQQQPSQSPTVTSPGEVFTAAGLDVDIRNVELSLNVDDDVPVVSVRSSEKIADPSRR